MSCLLIFYGSCIFSKSISTHTMLIIHDVSLSIISFWKSYLQLWIMFRKSLVISIIETMSTGSMPFIFEIFQFDNRCKYSKFLRHTLGVWGFFHIAWICEEIMDHSVFFVIHERWNIFQMLHTHAVELLACRDTTYEWMVIWIVRLPHGLCCR